MWFGAFLAARSSAKPSAHTLRAYCQDFDAIYALMLSARGGPTGRVLSPDDITCDTVREAFSRYAPSRSAATVRRCWSTWNAVCAFLFEERFIDANPMGRVRRPKADELTPKSLDRDTVAAVLATIAAEDSGARNSRTWPERDQAMVLVCLLAGLRTEELVGSNIGDIKRSAAGALIHVRGKYRKERDVPIEPELVAVIERYLDSRAARFPRRTRRHSPAGGLALWPPGAPLFVGVDDGERISRETVQYRVIRAFKRAGKTGDRPAGALLHAFRHTYATELANAEVSVYALKDLLGHKSIATTQRYVDAAGAHTRAAAAKNPLYRLLDDEE